MPQFFLQKLDRQLRRFLSFILMFWIGAIAVSCTTSVAHHANPAYTTSVATAETTPPIGQPLQVAVIPARSAAQQQERLKSLQAYLQQTLNRPVNVQITKDYDTAVEWLVSEKADMAYLGAITYLKAREHNADMEPLVLPIEQTSGRPWYTGVIVADTSKGIKTLADLKGKRFAFVSPSSTTGFFMPMDELQQQGIDPTRDFSGIRYSGNHDQAVADLVANQVDAISIEKVVFLKSQQAGKLNSSRYQVLWESEPVPTTPVVINTAKFSPETILHLKRSLINAPEGLVDVNGSSSNGYTVGKDADFATIRQIYVRLKTVIVPAK